MQKIFLLLVLAMAVSTVRAQNRAFQYLEISMNFGLQNNDQRVLYSQDEINNYGAYQIGYALHADFYQKGPLKLKVGLGMAEEFNTHSAGYNHCPNPGQFCDDVLWHFEKYHILLAQIPFSANIQVAPHIGANFDVVPQFSFYKEFKVYGEQTSKLKPEFYSLEYLAGISWTNKNLSINLGYRVAQIKAIDKNYLYRGDYSAKNPSFEAWKFDTYNPSKFVLSVAYKIIE